MAGVRKRYVNMKSLLIKLFLGLFIFLSCLMPANLVEAGDLKKLTPYEWHVRQSVVNSDFETVVAAMTNYEKYGKILPYVDEIHIVSQDKDATLCYVKHKIFWMELKFQIKQNDENVFILKTTYNKGNAQDFESIITVKRLENNKTLVNSKLRVNKPGPMLIPDRAINRFVDSFLDKSIKNLNKFLDKQKQKK